MMIRRLVLANAIAIFFVLTVLPYLRRLAALGSARDLGSDWRWLQDGLLRLRAGLPLTRPEYVTGPWSQFAEGRMVPTYAWSLHPPYNATLFGPLMLVPAGVRELVWAVAMAGFLVLAVWLVWPRRLWWGTGLLIAALLLRPPISGIWGGLIDQVHYGNPNALVMLGVALVWLGRRRSSVQLMTVGLVLAAVKILPAAALACWLVVPRSEAGPARRAVVLSGVALAALSLPILVLDPGAITDMVASQLNLVPWPGAGNYAPQIRWEPLLGATVAAAVSRAIGVSLMLAILVRRLDGPGGFVLAALAPLFLTPQLWAHWFLIPAVALLATAPEWRLVQAVDRRIRALMAGPTTVA